MSTKGSPKIFGFAENAGCFLSRFSFYLSVGSCCCLPFTMNEWECSTSPDFDHYCCASIVNGVLMAGSERPRITCSIFFFSVREGSALRRHRPMRSSLDYIFLVPSIAKLISNSATYAYTSPNRFLLPFCSSLYLLYPPPASWAYRFCSRARPHATPHQKLPDFRRFRPEVGMHARYLHISTTRPLVLSHPLCASRARRAYNVFIDCLQMGNLCPDADDKARPAYLDQTIFSFSFLRGDLERMTFISMTFSLLLSGCSHDGLCVCISENCGVVFSG